MKFCSVFIISLSIIFGCSKKDENILIIGTSADYPPFEFVREGEIIGFDIDIAKEIAKELDMEAKVIDMDFASLIPALNNDQIDLAISSFTITEDRKKNIDFSDIYYQGYYGILYKKSLVDKDNFDNKRVGVQLGSVWEIMMKQKKLNHKNLEIISLPKINMLVEELKIDRIDMIVLDSEQASNFAGNNKSLSYKISEEVSGGLAIALKLDSPFKLKINSILNKMKESKIKDLKNKWFKTK